MSDKPQDTTADEKASTAKANNHKPVNDRKQDLDTVDSASFDPEGVDWVVRVREWVEDNPILAVAGAAVAGLVIGRVVAALIPEPEPETLKSQIERRAKELAKQSKSVAGETSEVVSAQLSAAAEALSEASKTVAKGAKKGIGEAKDFGEYLAETIGDALAAKASQWLDKR